MPREKTSSCIFTTKISFWETNLKLLLKIKVQMKLTLFTFSPAALQKHGLQ